MNGGLGVDELANSPSTFSTNPMAQRQSAVAFFNAANLLLAKWKAGFLFNGGFGCLGLI
jgi:hypothetical protein